MSRLLSKCWLLLYVNKWNTSSSSVPNERVLVSKREKKSVLESFRHLFKKVVYFKLQILTCLQTWIDVKIQVYFFFSASQKISYTCPLVLYVGLYDIKFFTTSYKNTANIASAFCTKHKIKCCKLRFARSQSGGLY